MKLNIIKKIAFSSLLAVFFSGCVNDHSDITMNPETTEEPAAVEFTVPLNGFSFTAGTKADQSSTYQEGWISNMYLIIIKEKDSEGKDVNTFNIVELDTSGYNPQVGEDKKYNKFYVNLYPGTYRFYLLANFDRYLNRFTHVSDILSEKELKDVVLNFTADMPLLPSHLPMAAEPLNFSYNYSTIQTVKDENGEDTEVEIFETEQQDKTNGRVKIVSGSAGKKNHIYATLQFLCSKVRYTILYDNTVGGFSEKFGNSSIRFIINQSTDRPTARNIRRQTRFFPGLTPLPENVDQANFYIMPPGVINDDAENRATWTLEINRYEFKGADYPTSPNDNLTIWPENLASWKESRQRAWQGIVYLPENNPKEDLDFADKLNDVTILRFPYVIEKYKGPDGTYQDADLSALGNLSYKEIKLFGNAKETHYDYNNELSSSDASKGLKRGYAYDVVAKVVNPDEGDLEMFVQVSATSQNWVFHDNGNQVW